MANNATGNDEKCARVSLSHFNIEKRIELFRPASQDHFVMVLQVLSSLTMRLYTCIVTQSWFKSFSPRRLCLGFR